MTIFAVDPGKEGTGVAALYDGYREADQFKVPRRAFEWVRDRWQDGDTLLVESYLGSGHNTAESKETLKVIGLFQYGAFTFGADNVLLRSPQLRLSGVAEATEFVETTYPDRPWRVKKDAIAALAHAITFQRHLERVS